MLNRRGVSFVRAVYPCFAYYYHTTSSTSTTTGHWEKYTSSCCFAFSLSRTKILVINCDRPSVCATYTQGSVCKWGIYVACRWMLQITCSLVIADCNFIIIIMWAQLESQVKSKWRWLCSVVSLGGGVMGGGRAKQASDNNINSKRCRMCSYFKLWGLGINRRERYRDNNAVAG